MATIRPLHPRTEIMIHFHAVESYMSYVWTIIDNNLGFVLESGVWRICNVHLGHDHVRRMHLTP